MNIDKNLNISFSGSFEFLQYVISKYESYLGYRNVNDFAKSAGYKDSSTTSYRWKVSGIPNRAWNSLHKDLLIIFLTGKISIEDCDLISLKNTFQTE